MNILHCDKSFYSLFKLYLAKIICQLKFILMKVLLVCYIFNITNVNIDIYK